MSKAEAITYTQVFDENGKPRVPRDNISPADAKDMDGVFFLRRVIDPVTQQDTYLPIEYCGKWYFLALQENNSVSSQVTSTRSSLGCATCPTWRTRRLRPF